MSPHPDWIVPDWPAPPHVQAFITTRAGGVSTGPYASLNLGTSVGDAPAAVTENRARVRAVLPGDPVWLKQMHGTAIVDAGLQPVLPPADASYATGRNVVCTIQIADCLPVLFTDRAGTLVAAAHAGWRGLAGGVLRSALSVFAAHGVSTKDVIAYIGPGIGPGAFEVGQDVYEAFAAPDPGAAAAFVARGNGKWLADLHALARRALGRLGVAGIYGETLCTASDPLRFFSYRRDKVTGRMAAMIWRTGQG